MKELAFLFIAVVFAGCNVNSANESENSNVEILLEEERYSESEVVYITLVNNSEKTVGYNFCFANLQRIEGGEVVTLRFDAVCTAIMLTVKPGAKAEGNFNLRRYSNLTDGTYRLATTVEIGEETLTLYSEPFQIEVSEKNLSTLIGN